MADGSGRQTHPGLCVSAARQLGPTVDEPFYVVGGLEYWRTGSHSGLFKKGTMPLPIDLDTLAVFLRKYPEYMRDVLVLSRWGVVLAGLMWWKGPRLPRMVPFFWPPQAAALLSWTLCWAVRRRHRAGADASPTRPPP